VSGDEKVVAEWIATTGEDGPEGWLARPADREPRGAVVVTGEMFGVTGHLKDVCARLAAAGYAALAPDVYWRYGRRTGLDADEAGRARGRELMTGLRRDEALADLAAARTAALRHTGPGGVAALGFSLGGHLAVLASTELRFDLVVSYYGGWLLDGGLPVAEPVAPVGNAAGIAANTGFLLGFFGADDFVMPIDEWERVGRRLAEAGAAYEQVTYRGVGHGFFCDERPATYDARAAADAWGRTLAALERYVDPAGRQAP
jgi:carboxymethylenebutenolidase